jgi:hypothetical protein
MKMDAHGTPGKLHLRNGGLSYEDVICRNQRNLQHGTNIANTNGASRRRPICFVIFAT